MQNDWYFIGLYHTQLNYAEWLILYWIVPYSTKLCRMIDTLLILYHTQLNYAEWLIPYSTKLRMIDFIIVPYSTKLCRMIDTLLDCTILN